MNKSINKIIPCLNVANEIIQPIRLHCKLLKVKDFESIINKIKCLDYDSKFDFFHWYYADEMLHNNYKIEKKTTDGSLWILGKIQVINFDVLISVNSIQRAILALKFFNEKFGKKVLRFETFDFHNKLLESTASNNKLYSPIEKYFVTKHIISDNSVAIMIKEIMQKNILKEEKQKLVEQLIFKTKTEQLPEYENLLLNFYDDGIKNMESKLFIRQRLAYEHLQGNINMTLYDCIEKTIAENH